MFILFAALLVSIYQQGHSVIGVDNLSDYFEVSVNEAPRPSLTNKVNFGFNNFYLTANEEIAILFGQERFNRGILQASQGDVRYIQKIHLRMPAVT